MVVIYVRILIVNTVVPLLLFSRMCVLILAARNGLVPRTFELGQTNDGLQITRQFRYLDSVIMESTFTLESDSCAFGDKGKASDHWRNARNQVLLTRGLCAIGLLLFNLYMRVFLVQARETLV